MNDYHIDRERWGRFTTFEQMGNIGSEVGRAFNSKKRGDEAAMQGAMVRALELFSATVEILTKQKSVRAKEVLRSRDQFLTLLTSPNATPDELDALEKYFMRFALTARANR